MVVVVVVATPPHGGASDLIVSLSQTEFVTQTKTMTQQTDATEEVKIIQHHWTKKICGSIEKVENEQQKMFAINEIADDIRRWNIEKY